MNEKVKAYELFVKQCATLMEEDMIANMANLSAAINEFLNGINWVGFYIMRNGELVLGPFQGKPACVRIKIGDGVCGRAVEKKKTLVVPNVHEFPGHIACDSNTNSEIVVPIEREDDIIGVLDIDSTELNRFDEIDAKYLKRITNLIK
jgi:GAF domain-containing protein